MATPMTGPPVLPRDDSRSRGRRWLYLSILGAMAASWAVNEPPPGAARRLGSPPLARAGEARGAWGPESVHRQDEDSIGPTRVSTLPGASNSNDSADGDRHVSLKPVAGNDLAESPIRRALRMIDDCQARYESVRDYVCTFSKRERINGRLTPLHVMTMKVRTRPRSVYLKFRQPRAGREAIYVDGRNDGKVLAHDVGLGRLLVGTLWLDPEGPRAMEDCRHPITHAGIGPLLETLEDRWSSELDPSESLVNFRDGACVGRVPVP